MALNVVDNGYVFREHIWWNSYGFDIYRIVYEDNPDRILPVFR